MNYLNTVALRPATDGARAARLSAANDLVRNTLAQHGLMPTDGAPQPSAAGLDLGRVMAQFTNQASTVAQAPLPDGAEFVRGSFTCPSGTRDYRLYVPNGPVTGLVVMLHGCTQNSDDFAAGTGMNALADTHGFLVLYPQQSRGDNAQSCWNWFSVGDQKRARGEPAILAGMTRKVMDAHDVPPAAVFVAGLSAGAAMAVILGQTYPDLFGAVGAHSGLPYGAARDVPSAFAAMAGNGSDRPAAPPPASGTSPRTIVFHGSTDATVHPSNGEKIARDALEHGAKQTLHETTTGTTGARRHTRIVETAPDGTAMLEHWVIDGLGHAWSGGSRAGSYTDPDGPDASSEMVRFFFNPTSRTL